MKTIRLLLIIGIMILIMMNSCSLLIDGYTRNVGYNSICWEDNDHILVYAKIAAYDDYTTIGGGARKYIWVGGEIWRINVNTGEKELLMRKKENEYAINEKYAKITKSDNMLLISETFITYEIKEDYNGWDSIGNYVEPVFSSDEQYIVAIQRSNDYETEYVKKYNLSVETEEILYQTTESFNHIDYNYIHNLLLIDNIKLIDLNTGVETVLIEDREIIDGYLFSDPELYARYGRIIGDSIQLDINDNKIYINIDSINQKNVDHGLKGIPNPERSKYASGEDNGVEIRNSFGALITKVIFDNSGL